MPDSRIDIYIENCAPFARPILLRLREIVHIACPDAQEAIKWGMPAFLHGGKIFANMAAFKGHAVFGVWHGPEAEKPMLKSGTAMGSLGRLTSVDDLPDEAKLAAMIRTAMIAIDHRATARRVSKTRPEPVVPEDFAAALAQNGPAQKVFNGFAPSHRREYVEWIVSAKREETRIRRIVQASQWIAEGKKRHWKYENC